MLVGILTLHIRIPGCSSLKDKRSQMKPLLFRIHREFNVSVAETDLQDKWTQTIIAAASISNDAGFIQVTLNHVVSFIKKNHRDLEIIRDSIELF